MKIEFFCRRGNPHHAEAAQDFAAGCKRHGLTVGIWPESDGAATTADLAVMWGARMLSIQERQARRGRDFMIMENGFVGPREVFGPRAVPGAYISLGYNGLNGRADFMNTGAPADRLAPLDGWLGPEPEGERDGYILLIGQVAGDASLAGVNIDQWYRDAVMRLRGRFGDKPIVFRPHPLHARLAPAGAVVNLGQRLEDALEGAAFVVTYNSNTGVDAVLAGVPVIACDEGSMVWRVAGQGLEARPVCPSGLMRRQWLANISYAQWTRDEIRSGAAWDHLAPAMVG